ncbi:MAG: prephenate dehydratase [Flavobacteriales bacterium]|nr:MAG: prephenate dehydratase [Flavobacteriales bacterium]
MKIAIQGILGSFHHLVANQYFGKEMDYVSCDFFHEMPVLLTEDKVDAVVMAIENTLAGSILPNYALINEYDLKIQGEVHIPIHHHLLAVKGQKFEDIKEVRSHPMAILQCKQFFRKHSNIRLVEETDTALVAKQISEEKITGVAAIASKIAAKIYGLEVIESGIQTRKENYTRFFILKKNNGSLILDKNLNKASIRFVTHHKTGSLAEVLNVFADFDMNLSKIQSLPIIDQPWNYAFFADIIFKDYNCYQEAIAAVEKKVSEIKILGEYQKSKRNYDT